MSPVPPTVRAPPGSPSAFQPLIIPTARRGRRTEELDQYEAGDEPTNMSEVRDAALCGRRDAADAVIQLAEEPEADEHEGRNPRVPKWKNVD